MKKILAIALAVVMLIGATSALAAENSAFLTWFEEEGCWRTIANDTSANEGGVKGGFRTDAAAAPTVEDLKEMLHFASRAVTSNGKTDWYMIAVTDPAEQKAIIGDKWGVATSEGTATILVFTERCIRTELRTDDSNPYTPDRGYYDSGIVTGYLNIAAIAKGFGTHMFMTPALEGVNGFNNGERGLDCSKYIDGTTYVNGNDEETYSNDNMKFVCAVVIGTLDDTVETGLTTHEFPENWMIYDAQ